MKELDKATIQKYFGEEDLINKEETEEELDHKAEIEMLDDEGQFQAFC